MAPTKVQEVIRVSHMVIASDVLGVRVWKESLDGVYSTKSSYD